MKKLSNDELAIDAIRNIVQCWLTKGQNAEDSMRRITAALIIHGQRERNLPVQVPLPNIPSDPPALDPFESRMDVIGQNGNDGEHYDVLPPGLTWESAPEWANVLIKGENVYVWATAYKDGARAVEAWRAKGIGRFPFNTISMPGQFHAWTLVATRPGYTPDPS